MREITGYVAWKTRELPAAFGWRDPPRAVRTGQRDAAARHASAVRAIEADPGVRALCETFGARIEVDQVRPTDRSTGARNGYHQLAAAGPVRGGDTDGREKR